MAMNIWGINPKTKKAECYALHQPVEEIPRLMQKAISEGWTKLTTGTTTTESEDMERQKKTTSSFSNENTRIRRQTRHQ